MKIVGCDLNNKQSPWWTATQVSSSKKGCPTRGVGYDSFTIFPFAQTVEAYKYLEIEYAGGESCDYCSVIHVDA